MSSLKGFWSYSHADDDADEGRITKLARDLVSQYQMITGETIELFLDRDSIGWGEDWQAKIDASLESVAFFIPVLTPRFFLSSQCRQELNYFIRQANRLGVSELVMPILYVDVAALHDDVSSDDAIELIKAFNWEDWRELRFNSAKSPSYRRAVAEMADKLVAANKSIDETDTAIRSGSHRVATPTSPGADEPGEIELLATMEATLPEWTDTINEISKNINLIAPIMNMGTSQVKTSDKMGKGLAGRLQIMQKVSKELTHPAIQIESLGQQYSTQLYDVDAGIKLLISKLSKEAQKDENSVKEASKFYTSIENIAKANNESVASLKEMLSATAPLEGMSRDLRKPLRLIRKGLTSMIEGQEIIDNWLNLRNGQSNKNN
jgi:TIR domain-containing protein